jgi:hypothetical protein
MRGESRQQGQLPTVARASSSASAFDPSARSYTVGCPGCAHRRRCDGASRAELETVITCAMAAWDTLASAGRRGREG